MSTRKTLIADINKKISALDTEHLHSIISIADILSKNVKTTTIGTPLFDQSFIKHFSGLLLIHHALSKEPFTKDKFEYAMDRTLTICGIQTQLSNKGNPGHDLTVQNERWSLKTQADKSLKLDSLHISKFMELGKGEWTDQKSLIGLRQRMLDHMINYDRIFSLRHKLINRSRYYELVEIPKKLLQESVNGSYKMMMDSTQNPKPGYYTVTDDNNDIKFQLYFDGGTERKLQIRKLKKSLCIVHASWKFTAF